jgi:hypothetical protein
MEKEYLTDQEHPAILWMAERKKQLLWAFFILILLVIGVIRLASRSDMQTETDFISAQNDLNLMTQNKGTTVSTEEKEAALVRLQNILSRYPELRSKYDGMVAQILLAMDKPDQSAPYLERALSRTTDKNLPNFAQFANLSITAQENKLQDVLDQSIALKNKLANDKDSPLYAYNLLRIGLTARLLENKEKEKQAFKEFIDNSENPGFQKVIKTFEENQLFIVDYMKNNS